MLFVADISSRRERMAGDDEWAGHLLGMMADGDRKARRGRNLLLGCREWSQGSGCGGGKCQHGWVNEGTEKGAGGMVVKVVEKVPAAKSNVVHTKGTYSGITTHPGRKKSSLR